MISIARKNLFSDKIRLIVSVGGVAFSILLIIFFMGVLDAFASLVTVYLENSGADIIVAQEGATDMIHTSSILGKEKIAQIKRVSGGQAYGLISKTTNVLISEEDGSKIIDYPGRSKDKNTKGKKKIMSFTGFDTKTMVGGPWLLLAGTDTPGKGEIVVDKVFIKQTNLDIGDQIELMDEIFTIVGITDKNNLLVFTRGFVKLEEAQRILKERGNVNFILVTLEDPSKAVEISEKLEDKISGISSYTIEEFAVSSGEMITDSFIPILMVVTVIGFITGAVIVGITIYTATVEKEREYGVLKAIGTSNKKLFMIVLEQALLSSLMGYVVGVALFFLVKKVVIDAVAVMAVEPTPEVFVISFVTTLFISVVASFVPTQKIFSLDPASVFNK